MAKKLYIKKSLLTEASMHAENIPDELVAKKEKPIEAMWDDIFNPKRMSQDDFEKQNIAKTADVKAQVGAVNISRIDKIKVIREDGSEDFIEPAKIAAMAREAVAGLFREKNTTVLAKYFPKDIIWTFHPSISTAATDGVRIFMNPIFADYCLMKDMQVFGAKARANGDKSMSFLGRFIQYVIIHEVYHQVFQHRRRAELKAETAGGKNHELANIAMDVEINRVIENELMQFQGCTKALQGMWDERFQFEAWEEIFDAYNSGKVAPPNMTQPSNSGSGNPQQKNQQSQSNQNQQGQQQQQGNKQQNNQGQQQKPNFDEMNPWYKKGFAQALQDIKDGKIAVQAFKLTNFETPASPEEQAEYDQGYKDAIKMYQDMIRQQKAQQNNQQGQSGQQGQQQSGNNQNGQGDQNGNNGGNQGDEQDGGQQGQNGQQSQGGNPSDYGDDVSQNDTVDGSQLTDVQTGGNSQFGGMDLIDTELAQEIAADAGQPYDMQDIKDAQNVEKKASDFVKQHREELENISRSPKSSQNGNCASTASTLGHIDELLKPKVNWRSMLKHYLNQLAKTGKEATYSRKLLGTTNPDLEAGRYIKYRDKEFYKKSGVAQVFHLIDGSGSMGDENSENFQAIFTEIFNMGQKAHILKSAMTYFGCGTITPDNVRTWDDGARKAEVLKIINRQSGDNGGGTDVLGSINNVINLGKPYFSQSKPNTLLIVYTDGDDTRGVDTIPTSVLRNSIWLICNRSEQYARNAINELNRQGIPASRTIYIDTNDL